MDAGTLRLWTEGEQPITLYPGKLKWSSIAIVSAIAAASGWQSSENQPLLGWFLIVIGAAMFVWSLLQVAECGSYLMLAPNDFTLRTITGTKTYAWSDVKEVRIIEGGAEYDPKLRLRFRDGAHRDIGETFGLSIEGLAQIFRTRTARAAEAAARTDS